MGKNSGYIVLTADGKTGTTKHSNGLINGKVPVYIDGEDKPRLCDPKNLKHIGFVD